MAADGPVVDVMEVTIAEISTDAKTLTGGFDGAETARMGERNGVQSRGSGIVISHGRLMILPLHDLQRAEMHDIVAIDPWNIMLRVSCMTGP